MKTLFVAITTVVLTVITPHPLEKIIYQPQPGPGPIIEKTFEVNSLELISPPEIMTSTDEPKEKLVPIFAI